MCSSVMSHTTEENHEDIYLFTYLFVYCGISGFRREVEKNCALLGHYAASRGNLLPTFWEQYFDPIFRDFGFLSPENGTDKLSSETSVRKYHYSLRNDP